MALNKEKKKQLISLNNKRKQRILDATDNGRCWWIYQQLVANPRQSRTGR